jgi:hypothetical protein
MSNVLLDVVPSSWNTEHLLRTDVGVRPRKNYDKTGQLSRHERFDFVRNTRNIQCRRSRLLTICHNKNINYKVDKTFPNVQNDSPALALSRLSACPLGSVAIHIEQDSLQRVVKQISFWVTNSRSASQEIPRLLRDLKTIYRARNISPLDPILGNLCPIHALSSYFCTILPFRASTKAFIHFLPSPTSCVLHTPFYLSALSW